MLTITFALWIYDSDFNENDKLRGPIFTNWLPDGECDALKVPVAENSAEVSLWFERHGFVKDGGLIEYEHKKLEINPDILLRQKKVYAGALYGKVVLHDISPEQISVLKTNETENEEYKKLGKLILKKILDPVLSRFTAILKKTYGQYWIELYQKFDSRNSPLANHCAGLNMKWINEDGDTGDFVPGTKVRPKIYMLASNGCSKEEYISKGSWFHIEDLLNNEFEATLSSAFSSRANQLLNEQRFSHSLLEAVTAIELSLEEYIQRTIQIELKGYLKSFWNNPLPTRILIVSSLVGANTDDITLCISAVKHRNDLVHDGTEPPSSISEIIKGILRTVSHLNKHQKLKFPSPNSGNTLEAPP